MVHFQRPPHHPVLRHFGFEVLAVATRPLGPCWVVHYCCWLRRDPTTVQASSSQKCRSVTDCYREWHAVIKTCLMISYMACWQSESDHLTFMGSYGFSTKPKILLHSKKKKSDYLYFYMKIRFCFFFKFYRNFSVRLLLLFFFYLSGQLFFSIQFGDRNYNKTYTLPLKVKWPYPNKKCWFIIYSVSLGPFRNKVGLI